jgi:hypothetical protein
MFYLLILNSVQYSEIIQKGCFALLPASLVVLQKRIFSKEAGVGISQTSSDLGQVRIFGSNDTACRASDEERNQAGQAKKESLYDLHRILPA